MALGCIDAAISLVGLFQKFVDADQTPRRLPMVVYAMFYAALSLGLAIFGDLDSNFTLQGNIQTASELLGKFAKHDWLAERYAIVVNQLQAACKKYVLNRSKTMTCAHRAHVQQLFESLELRKTTSLQDPVCLVSQGENTLQTLTSVSTELPINQPPVNVQRAIGIDFLTCESFCSHPIGLFVGQELGEESDTCAGGLLPGRAAGDTLYEPQIWHSIWFDEYSTNL